MRRDGGTLCTVVMVILYVLGVIAEIVFLGFCGELDLSGKYICGGSLVIILVTVFASAVYYGINNIINNQYEIFREQYLLEKGIENLYDSLEKIQKKEEVIQRTLDYKFEKQKRELLEEIKLEKDANGEVSKGEEK